MNVLKRNWLMGAVAASAMLSVSGVTSADVVHLDDTIVVSSLCVGIDCASGESFGFDTLRLKENNLRVHFQDTSVSSSFPTNDWRIIINDSTNGGSNYFAIEDSGTGRQIFRVDALAPADSLRISASGDIGIGTSTPVVELHVKDGNTPSLRLEQDGSSGFAPHAWDVAGNETNFFIRDVTGGGTLPFRIEPNAGGDALYIDSTGDIGLATSSPEDRLHLADGSGSYFGVRYEDRSSGGAGSTWRTLVDPRVANDSFVITKNGTGASEMVIESGGNVTILGSITTGGATCGGGCDLVFTDGYDLPSIDDHADAMWSSGYLPNIGPTVENEPLNVSDKVGRMLNELETAHIYIDQLNERLAVLEAQAAQDDG
jgi:hypothetical protein